MIVKQDVKKRCCGECSRDNVFSGLPTGIGWRISSVSYKEKCSNLIISIKDYPEIKG
jgi:hypothetical protein